MVRTEAGEIATAALILATGTHSLVRKAFMSGKPVIGVPVEIVSVGPERSQTLLSA